MICIDKEDTEIQSKRYIKINVTKNTNKNDRKS